MFTADFKLWLAVVKGMNEVEISNLDTVMEFVAQLHDEYETVTNEYNERDRIRTDDVRPEQREDGRI